MNPADLRDRARALGVDCPIALCAAQPGDPCINQHTGKPLVYLPAHEARLRAAGVVRAPVPTYELADPEQRRGGHR